VSESAAIGFPDHGQVSFTASSRRSWSISSSCLSQRDRPTRRQASG
jgi:hypothetical protein